MKGLRFTVLFLAVAALAFAVAMPHGSAVSPAKVKVTLDDHNGMTLVVDKHTVKSGTVVFTVTNKGFMEHEFVILKTDLAFDKLPADPNEAGKAMEDGPGIKHIAEIDPVEAGKTKTLTVKLEPGKYVLICNKPGHYSYNNNTAGMRDWFTVTK